MSISWAKMCLAQIHADCLSSSHFLFVSFQRLDQLNAILLEQKQTSDSWFNVTCTWLKNNQDTWSNWIPDASQCFAGFGLYDETMQEFTNTRNTSNKIVCKASPGISWVTLNWAERWSSDWWPWKWLRTVTVCRNFSPWGLPYHDIPWHGNLMNFVQWTPSRRSHRCHRCILATSCDYVYISTGSIFFSKDLDFF